jgi:hypothetical protein
MSSGKLSRILSSFGFSPQAIAGRTKTNPYGMIKDKIQDRTEDKKRNSFAISNSSS